MMTEPTTPRPLGKLEWAVLILVAVAFALLLWLPFMSPERRAAVLWWLP